MTTAPLRQTADVPSLGIEINGERLPESVPVRSVEIINRANRIPLARLCIDDGDVAAGDFPYSSGDLFLPGNDLTVHGGYGDEVEPIFTGVVFRQRTLVRRNRTSLEIECRDACVKMTLSRRTRYHEEVSDSDIAEALIGEYGLTADIAATEVVHQQLLQYHTSDWDFMLSRLEVNAQICAVESGTVRSFIPSLEDDALVDIHFGDTLIELDAEFDARSQSGAIKTVAWSAADQDLIEADAADPAWQGNSDLTTDDMTGATSRQEDILLHGGTLASDALQSWADGALLRSRLAASRGRARFRGIASLHIGDVVELSAISARFNGKIFITAVRNEFSNNYWFTDIEFGLSTACHAENFRIDHLPAAGLLPAVHGLQIGVVTQLADDPAGESRVRVKIPVAGMAEQGVWARVATLDAGESRGTFFRPEVDDEVVLGFFHDDPAQPVILGMLHSSAKPPPMEATEENDEKGYVSREGLQMHFDDEQKIITLTTPGGNSVVLNDADENIVFEDQHGNTLEMSSDGITLTSVGDIVLKAQTDLKMEGVNMALKASAELKAEGGATTEVSSNGTMTVKGALVQIN